ncbi:MAG: sigma-70 family RNA polymerase sigma factor [Planctomycetota bacterium]|nr:sigma-70 family RNA polymerase sigma factor [Planctomycetota bacterium]MDI6788351.1 sigma-70 family RNA polymerase sigma factor [Planctomycetota bacterium]
METGKVELTDIALLKEYQEGNNAVSLEQLLTRYHKPLFNFIYRLSRDFPLSEDIIQESFLKVIRKIKGFAPAGENGFKQWVYQIAINTHRDTIKKKQPVSSVKLSEIASCHPDNSYDCVELLEHLTPEQKEVVLLKVYSGLTFREIAEVVGCPLNTAIGRMHYALKTLRKKLKYYPIFVK